MKYKNIKIISVILLFYISNINCSIPFVDSVIDHSTKSVGIEPDIVVLKNSIEGSIGYLGLMLYPKEVNVPFIDSLGIVDTRENNDKPSDDLLQIIQTKIKINCKYKSIKTSNAEEVYTKYPLFTETNYSSTIGYICFYDEKDPNGIWRMHPAAINYFNKYYSCDFYLAGRLQSIFTYDLERKTVIIEPNLLLILYNNKGYKEWSKLYKREYDYPIDRYQKNTDYPYFFINRMLNELSEEINNDLLFVR